MRESVQAKAMRYLTEGRLTLRSIDAERIQAHCRGLGEFYLLGYEPGRGWFCSCPAANDSEVPRCSHLIALKHVTVRNGALTPEERNLAHG